MTRTALSVAFLGIVLMTTASAFGKGGGEELRNGEDTWIEAAAPHEKRGGDATLRLLDGDLPAAALIRFDLNELSGKGAVVGAHVRLKLAAPVAGGPVTVELLTVPGADRGWGATTSTWASINDPGIFDLQTGKPIRTPWQSGPGLGQTDTGRLSGKAEIETAEAGETVDIPIGDIELINRWVLHTWEGAGFLLRVRGGSVAFHSFDARALADRPVFVARTEGGTEPATAISYTLERPGRVSVNIYNEQGGVVRELVQGATRLAGEHTEGWDGLDTRGEAVRPGAYTWKLLQTQGLNAEYVMSLGVNPKTPWDRWPGNHNPVTNVAVDDTGVYFSAGSNEGPPPVVKDTFEGKRLWTNTGHFGAFGGLYSLATMDGKLFAIAADGRIHRLNATTGRDEIALADTKARPTVLRDLATGAGQLVVSGADQNLVRWLSPEEAGKVLREVQVTQPLGVAVEKDGSVLVISDARVLRIGKAGEQREVIAADRLVGPARLDVDPKTGDILVVESVGIVAWALREMKLPEETTPVGIGQQVKRFSRDGELLRTYGEPGGRPKVGPYQPERGFVAPFDIIACLDGSFMVTDIEAPPRTVHYSADGRILREWFGGMAYGSYAGPDPADPTSVWMVLNYGYLMRMSVDYEERTWYPAALFRLDETPGWRVGGVPIRIYVRHHNGQTWLASDKFAGIARVDEQAGKIIPLTAMAFPMGGGAEPTDEILQRMKQNGKLTYQWADRNGNGKMELSEAEFPSGAMHSLGNSYVDENWNYYLGMSNVLWVYANRTRAGYAWYEPVGFTAQGTPIYDNEKQKHADPLPEFMSGHQNAGLWKTDDGHVFAAYNGGKGAGLGFWSARVGDNKLACFTADGKLKWVVGRHSLTGGAGPGEGRYFVSILGVVHDCPVVSDMESLFHVWDSDGLWVGRLLENPVLDGKPSYIFKVKCENFGGDIYQWPDGRVFLYASDENRVNVFSITGWDQFKRQAGKVQLP